MLNKEVKFARTRETFRQKKETIKNGIRVAADEMRAYKDDVIFYRDHARETRSNFYKNVRRRIEPIAAPTRAYRNDFRYYRYRFQKKRDIFYGTVEDKHEKFQKAVAQPTLPQVLGTIAAGMAVTLGVTVGATEAVRYALDHHDSPPGSSAPQVPGNHDSNNSKHHNQPRRIHCETMLPGYNYLCKDIVRRGGPIVLELGKGADFAYPHDGKGAQIEFPVQKNGTGSFSLPNGERLQVNRRGNDIFIHKVTY